MTRIDLRTGSWDVSINDSHCVVVDGSDVEVHHSDSWEQTAIHLAMSMDECRRLRAENRDLRNRDGYKPIGPSGEHANFG